MPVPVPSTTPGSATDAGDRSGGWVLPYWLDRQVEPSSPSFVDPAGHPAGSALPNVTARNWTAIGNLDSAHTALVDPRGLLTPWPGGWSLDWWAGADDRWRLPSREVAVRQRLVDDMPVVETAMRVPSGDLVHRVYGVRSGSDELIVVELENKSPIPMALALSVRPFNAEGWVDVHEIDVHDATTVSVDGRVALLMAKPPARLAGATWADGDVASIVLGGGAGDTLRPVRCLQGRASAAFVWPLAHRQVMRFAVPLVPAARTRRIGAPRRRVIRRPSLPSPVPTAEQVARGWRLQGDRGIRLVLPDPRLQSAVDANRRYLLLRHDDAAAGTLPFTDAADVVGALDRYGYDREAAGALAAYPGLQRGDGSLSADDREWAANGAALHALAEHWRLHRDEALAVEAAPTVARAAEWIEKKRHRGGAAGLFPSGPGGAGYAENFWGVGGLLAAAELLSGAGEDGAATAAARFAASFRADVDASLAQSAATSGSPAVPAGPGRDLDASAVDALAAAWPLRLWEAGDERLVATAVAVRDRLVHGAAVADGGGAAGGLDPAATLRLATAELVAGDRASATARLDWMLDAATSTWTWPGSVHERSRGGCAGDGHDRRVAARFLSFVRAMLVRETPGGTLALLSLVPAAWLGQGLEVHDAPTSAGYLSFAVRWHGERPALLWELAPHPGVTDVRFRAPGLDPSWSSTAMRGDALLAPVQAPGTPVRLSLKPRPR